MTSMARAAASTSAPAVVTRCRCMPTCVAALRPFTPSTVGAPHKRSLVFVPRSSDPEKSPSATIESDPLAPLDQQSITQQKAASAARLRAAEKFMVVGAGYATCKGCGGEYKPENGDPEFPISKGTQFENLPLDYTCPICGANKDKFETRLKVVAGFAENQKYGLGTNSMTGEQKALLIYGSLGLFFALFIAGYGMN